MPKKKWERPLLIVLVRGKPEERVLAGCKGTIAWGPGGASEYWGSDLIHCIISAGGLLCDDISVS